MQGISTVDYRCELSADFSSLLKIITCRSVGDGPNQILPEVCCRLCKSVFSMPDFMMKIL